MCHTSVTMEIPQQLLQALLGALGALLASHCSGHTQPARAVGLDTWQPWIDILDINVLNPGVAPGVSMCRGCS